MKLALAGLAFAYTVVAAQPAAAWGEPGHQIVGSIAEQILTKDHPSTEAQVRQLLGPITLAQAATWADCVRDVRKTANGFQYQKSKFTPAVCQVFQTPAEEARMVDYASRNWTDCFYSKAEGCHAAYHFADIAMQRGRYDESFVGAHPYDIVHAISAAIAVLQGLPAPPPFSIADKREALLMLAHFVGDLHQPLHVGAIYLDANGNVVDPDSAPDRGAASQTEGGNLIMDGTKNLHAEWDDIDPGLGTVANASLVQASEQLPSSTGPVASWPAQWASDTVTASPAAFSGLSFSGAGTRRWTVQFTDRADYDTARETLQAAQLEKAGARLAEVLAAVMP